MLVQKTSFMDNSIKFNDVNLKAKKYYHPLMNAISKVILSNQFLCGRQNLILEKNITHLLGKGYVVNVASGHDAILLALTVLNLQPNDEIIFPVNSYPTAFPINLARVKLVPCDVTSNGLIDPNEISKKITSHTKAIVIVHLYGQVVDINPIKKIIKKKNIKIIEDCAQAFGAKYDNHLAGTQGNFGCFSFYPTKNIGTLGDGGAILTNNKKYHQHLLQLRNYGERLRYQSQQVIGHSRLPEIQASILNVYLKHLKKELITRIRLVKYYNQKIVNSKLTEYIRPLNNNSYAPLHLYVVEVKKRDQLKKFLARKKITTFIHYPYPIHLVPAFSYLGLNKGSFPIAEKLSTSILSLPFHPLITTNEIDYLFDCLKEFYL